MRQSVSIEHKVNLKQPSGLSSSSIDLLATTATTTIAATDGRSNSQVYQRRNVEPSTFRGWIFWIGASFFPQGVSDFKGRQTHDVIITGGSLIHASICLHLFFAWSAIQSIVYNINYSPVAPNWFEILKYACIGMGHMFGVIGNYQCSGKLLNFILIVTRIQRNFALVEIVAPYMRYLFYYVKLPLYGGWYDDARYTWFLPFEIGIPPFSLFIRFLILNYLEDLELSSVNALQSGFNPKRPIYSGGHGDYDVAHEQYYIGQKQEIKDMESVLYSGVGRL